MKIDTGSLVLGLLVAVEYIAAQSLPSCAQTCVSHTRTRCKSTDYACACLDEKYINKLASCISKACDEASTHDAAWYLTSLCNTVGVPLERAKPLDIDAGSIAPPLRLEVREEFRQELKQRQFTNTTASVSHAASAASTSFNFAATGTANSSTSGETDVPGSSGSGSGSGSGLSGGAKLGLGLGISLGLLSVVGIVVLVLWFRRERKKERAAATGAAAVPPLQPQQQQQLMYPGGQHPPQMAQPGMMAPMAQPGPKPYGHGYQQQQPAELSQGAQYPGQEMHTQAGNTMELPAHPATGAYVVPPQGHASPPPQGYSTSPPPPQQQQQQGYMHPPQPYAHPPPQPQTQQFQQQHYPTATNAGASPVGQTQQHPEVPERRGTPNMYE